MFTWYVEIDLFVALMLVVDIGFLIKNCDTHVFACFNYDVSFVVNKLPEGTVLETCDVGS